MQLLAILYTNDMAASVRFYEAIGLQRQAGEVDDWWNEFTVGDAVLALHWNQGDPFPTQSNPALNFRLPLTDLESLYATAESTGLEIVQPMKDMEFVGKIFALKDPSGVMVQFNQSDANGA